MKGVIIALISLIFSVGVFAQSVDDYFHGSANLYIQGHKKEAKQKLLEGIAKYPNDDRLKKLAAKIKEDEEQEQQKQDEQQKQEQQKQEQQKQDQQQQNQQQQQQQQQQISKQDAERMLEALKNEEKKTMEKVNIQKIQVGKAKSTEKDW